MISHIFDKPAGDNAFYMRSELEPKIKALIKSINTLYLEELNKVTIKATDPAAGVVGECTRALRRATLRASGEMSRYET